MSLFRSSEINVLKQNADATADLLKQKDSDLVQSKAALSEALLKIAFLSQTVKEREESIARIETNISALTERFKKLDMQLSMLSSLIDRSEEKARKQPPK